MSTKNHPQKNRRAFLREMLTKAVEKYNKEHPQEEPLEIPEDWEELKEE
jgi:hypothetical protein